MTKRYQLTRTIKNPQADRRTRHDWSTAAQFEEGDRFEVVSKTHHLLDDHSFSADYLISSTTPYSHQTVRLDDPRAIAIIENSVEVEATTHEAVLEASDDFSASAILDRLVDDGIVSLDAIRAVARALNAELESEES